MNAMSIPIFRVVDQPRRCSITPQVAMSDKPTVIPGDDSAPSRRPVQLGDRFWSRVQKTEGCWFWTGRVDACGYGEYDINGKTRRAHRLAWEEHSGEPIPAGLKACHSCDTPRCVRPSHLFLGTQQDNVADMTAKGRRSRGENNGPAKLTARSVQEMRRLYSEGGVTQRDLAQLFGIARSCVWRIVNRVMWAHVEDEMPLQDPREQAVRSRRSAPVPIDLYRVTPASIAYAKQEAARERAEVDAAMRDTRRRNAKELLRDLVARHGLLDVRTMLDEIEGDR